MADFETILVERDGGVVTVTMNRPAKKNAINRTMSLELTAVFHEVRSDPDDRVLVLTGAAGDFSSGADLTDGSGPSGLGLQYMREIADLALALHRLPKPTIAKVPGVAAGMAANLALGCDLVVAADVARFSEIFAARGLSLDCGGSWLLPRLIGLHKAKELAFFADVIGAAEAERFGIVNRVVPAAELDRFVDDWATRLAAGPPIALSMTKTMLNNGLATSLDQALEDEARCQALNFTTADVGEAMAAFVEKRAANFRGI
jgi:2-(1,2-epoxy-1,2-dihydrophenyl)acetyl-CoA isomerase